MLMRLSLINVALAAALNRLKRSAVGASEKNSPASKSAAMLCSKESNDFLNASSSCFSNGLSNLLGLAAENDGFQEIKIWLFYERHKIYVIVQGNHEHRVIGVFKLVWMLNFVQ